MKIAPILGRAATRLQAQVVQRVFVHCAVRSRQNVEPVAMTR